MITQQHSFKDGFGNRLSAELDLPSLQQPKAYALFSHCFTCSKSLPAVRRIADSLTALGIGVFRFDFTGLGKSDGDFSEATFSSNVDDLYRASIYLEGIASSPQILIGHSLGGAAAIRAAALIDSLKAVVTIGAPADPAHVTHLFGDKQSEITSEGEAKVSIGRREFLIKDQFIKDLESIPMEEATASMGKALLIFHSPIDDIVGIENATKIYQRARHPKSFVSLDQADHLVTRESDAKYISEVIAAWASRYLDLSNEKINDSVRVRIGQSGFRTDILANGFPLLADEPISVGGTDLGPTPYDLLNASVGACTAMTLRMYADRKKWPLESVEINLTHQKIHLQDCETCEQNGTTMIDQIERKISLVGPLDAEQIERMLEIADRCPVHRTLESQISITTQLIPSPIHED